MRKLLSAVLLAIAASASTAQVGAQGKPVEQPPAPGKLRPYIVPPVQAITLDNGLRVLLVENHSLPRCDGPLYCGCGRDARAGGEERPRRSHRQSSF